MTDAGSAAAFLPSQPQAMAAGFLDSTIEGGQERTFPLIIGLGAAGGFATDSQSIVIFGDEAGSTPSGAVRISVVAL